MKKNLIAIFAFLFVMGLFAAPSYADGEKNVLKTDEKEAVMIDDTKMQDVSDMPSEKEIKKFKKEQEKLNKEKLKEEEKELKKQQKEQEKLQKEQLKAKNEELKEEKPAVDEVQKETKKEIQTEEKNEKAKNEEIKTEQKSEADPVVEASSKEEKTEIKEEKTVEGVKQEEPVEIKGESATDEAKLPENKQEATEEKTPAQLYRKNLTYEDIEKNAVSINEFLQFTDKQNEKFSLFYYKTTAKLNDLTKQIKNKEQEMLMVKRSKIAVKEQLKRLKKLEEETLSLYKERDEFYNKALNKFNSMLNKKQQIKWEILQEMGYRFFPEFE